MTYFTRPRRARASRRAAALTAAVALALPAVLGAGVPAVAAQPGLEDPAPAAGPVGGPRMAEKGLVLDPALPAPPAVGARSYVVADAVTGRILAAQDPHGRNRPASTQKTLLALTMMPRLDPNATYTAVQEDANQEGTRVGMWPGQAYKISDLWYALMLRSGNDAAVGLAKAGAGGDLAKGVQMMNDEAKRLQAFDTTVVSPSGLDEEGQYSSAYDLALWGREGLGRNDFSTYVQTVKWRFPGNHTATATPKTEKDFWVYTENRLLLQGYEGAIGVKMGYTTKAQNTMIAAAERDGKKILVTLMGVGFGGITPGAKALLEWGFANAGKGTGVGTLVEPASPAPTTYAGGAVNRPAALAADRADAKTVESIAAANTGGSSALPSGGFPAPVAAAVVLGALAAAILGLRLLAVRKRRREYWIAEVRRRNAAAAEARRSQGGADQLLSGADAAESGSGLAPASE